MPAVLIGAGLLALWVDARFPWLAPASLSRRVFALIVAGVALEATPVFRGSTPALYATIFGILLPSFVAVFLAAVWLLRAVCDSRLRA